MRYALLAFSLCVAMTGCSSNEGPTAFAPSPREALSAESPNRYMAYEHSLALEVEETRVATVHKAAESACQEAVAEQCVILESRLQTGRYVSAVLKVRAKPEGIRKLIAALSTQGDVVNQALSAEDLAGPIEDSAKKLEMLSDYRSKLESLRGKASSDIDALIKVNKELAHVQSEIEALSGQRAHLIKRVETEILNVSLSSTTGLSFWRPIGNALSDFGSNLSRGISGVITAIAFLVPWAILFLLLTWGSRKLWLRWKRTAAK